MLFENVIFKQSLKSSQSWLNTVAAAFLLQGPPHKCALFFVDNSGIDIILGVFPFIRELLIRGTEVS